MNWQLVQVVFQDGAVLFALWCLYGTRKAIEDQNAFLERSVLNPKVLEEAGKRFLAYAISVVKGPDWRPWHRKDGE